MSSRKSQTTQLQICQMLANILVTISKGEQILQCIRQVLVNHNLFSPMNLFKYLSHNSTSITKKNIITFLDQNSLVSSEKQAQDFVNRLFIKIGIQKPNKMLYTQFLNYVYPYNSSILRDVSTNKFKNYEQIEKLQKNIRPDPMIITGFLLLLQEEIQLERKIDAQISDSRFPGKDKIKKVLKSIKRASDKMAMTVTEQSSNHISSLQLRNFVRAFIDVPEHLFLYLGRKFGIDKNGQIPLENMENVLRKTKRHTLMQSQNFNENTQNENISASYGNEGQQKKHIRQLNYREQLYHQLASTLKLNTKNRTPRNKSISEYRAVSGPKTKTPTKRIQHKDVSGFLNSEKSKISQKKKEKGYINSIFRQFIQKFLKGFKQIEKCKVRLSQQSKIDFLSLFKSIDKGRGVVQAKDIQRFYIDLSGIPMDYDFQLLIDRFAVADEKLLSYSEFIQIFRVSSSKQEPCGDNSLPNSQYRRDQVLLTPEMMRIIAQIIYLTLELQFSSRKILSKLSEQDRQWLFHQINVDIESKGFINYQQLKKYLTSSLKMNLSMIDLMTLLKRLDKSKNGVVVHDEFLCV